MSRKNLYRMYRRIKGYCPIRAFWRAYVRKK